MNKLNKIFFKILIKASYNGYKYTNSEESKYNLQFSNLFYIITIVNIFIGSLIKLLFGYYYLSFVTILFSIPNSLSYYLNSKGKFLTSKVLFCIFNIFGFLGYNLIVASDNLINNFLLLFLIGIGLLFTFKELKWQFFFIIIIIFLLLILKDSNCNKMINRDNVIDLIHTVFLVSLFLGINYLELFIKNIHQNKLIKTNQRLIKITKKQNEQNETLKVFGIAATHSLKTPLYVSNSFVEITKQKIINKENNDKIFNSLDIIKNSNDQMELFIVDLFAFYKVSNRYKDLKIINITKELKLIKNFIIQKYPNTFIEILGGDYFFKTDLILFKIIFENLIENGIKYNKSIQKRISISYSIYNDYLDFMIIDNGIGINKSYNDSIFEPFHRINDLVEVSGSGLGLTICKKAIEKINGQIFLLDSSKKGSTFNLKIYFK